MVKSHIVAKILGYIISGPKYDRDKFFSAERVNNISLA